MSQRLGAGSNQLQKVDTSIEGSTSINKERAAKLNGVARAAVDRFRCAKNRGIPELLTAVKADQAVLTKAADKISLLSEADQVAALQATPAPAKQISNRGGRRENGPA